jgi:hypothetical protein
VAACRDCASTPPWLFRTGWDRHGGTESDGDPCQPFVGIAAVDRLVPVGPAVVGIGTLPVLLFAVISP